MKKRVNENTHIIKDFNGDDATAMGMALEKYFFSETYS